MVAVAHFENLCQAIYSLLQALYPSQIHDQLAESTFDIQKIKS